MSAPSLTAVLGRAAKAAISPTLTPAEIARRVAQAEEYLADLETRRGELALAAETDELGAGNKLAAFNADVTRAKDRLVTLRAAQAHAIKVDAEQRTRAARDIHVSRVKAARAHLAAGRSHALNYSRLMTEAVHAWHAMKSSLDAAQAASPVRFDGGGLSPHGLQQAAMLHVDGRNGTVTPHHRAPGGRLSQAPGDHISLAAINMTFGDRVGTEVDALLERLATSKVP